MVRAAGIQFEDDYIFGVVIEKDPFKICEWIEITDTSEKVRKKMLKDFLHRADVTSYRTAISLPARNAIWRKFSVPFTQEEEIEKIITYESEQYIYSYSVEQLVIDYHILNSTLTQSRLLVCAVPKKTIHDAILWFEDCGLSPYIVELDILALLHTLPVLDAQNKEEILLLELHPKSCNIILLHKGEIKEIRAIPLKIDSFIGGVLADLHETTEISLKGDSITASLSPKLKHKIFSRIQKELTRTLLVADSHVHVYYCGDSALIQDLSYFFQNNFSLLSSPWTASQKLEVGKVVSEKVLSKLPVAIGLALKAMGETQGGFNLRKKEFQFQTFDVVKKRLARSITLLFLFLLLLSTMLFQNWQEKKYIYEQLLAIAKEKNNALLLENDYESIEYWNKISIVKEKLLVRLEESQNILPQIPDAFHRCADLLQKIAATSQSYLFTIESIRVESHELILEGRTQDDLLFDLWKKRLSNASWIDQQEDSIKLIESKFLPSVENKKLFKSYKFWIKSLSEK